MVRISDMAKCMAVDVRVKLLLTTLSVVLLTAGSRLEGFSAHGGLLPHFTYSFLHANVWHMAANLLVLWGVRQRMNVAVGYVIAVAASWMPMWADKPTVGMSGMLFAMFGIMWGKTGRWKEYLKAGMPVILIMMLIPNVNGLLHLYCYILGFVFSFLRFKVC